MANLILTVQSSDVSMTLEGIADALNLRFLTANGSFVSRLGIKLTGKVQDLAGVLSSDAAYEVQRLEEKEGLSSSGDWCYYAGQVASSPTQWLKVWIRWSPEKQIYDYYLEASTGAVFAHATPYIGTVL